MWSGLENDHSIMAADTSLDPEQAKQLFYEGATFLFFDVPQDTEFGIDYNSWNVGPKFKGVKMIPPGLHFIYYSAVNKNLQIAPRTGFWYYFKQKEILVKKWDKLTEDAVDVEMSEDELLNFRANLEELDTFLGAYPYSSWKRWVSLTNFITENVMEKVQPLNKKISSVAELVVDNGEVPASTTSRQTISERNLPLLRARPGTEIRFSKFPDKPYPEGCSPSEISKHHMDYTYSLNYILQNNTNSSSDFLGEIQFAFVCFLVGQLYDAFETWKKLITLMCFCQDALIENKKLFFDFIFMLHFELKEIPKDFFVDIVSKDNFLTTTLQVLFSNLQDECVDEDLKLRGRLFKEHLTKKFKWDFNVDPDEFAPVIVV